MRGAAVSAEIVELARFQGPCVADIHAGEVVALAMVDSRTATRQRWVFPADGTDARPMGTEPGRARCVRSDAEGLVVVGDDEVTLCDARGERRIPVEGGLGAELATSGTLVAGASTWPDRARIQLLSRATGALQRLELKGAKLRSIAVSDTHIAWVDGRGSGGLYLAEAHRLQAAQRLSIDAPEAVSFIGGELYVQHRPGDTAIVKRAAGAWVPLLRCRSSLIRLLGDQTPMVLWPQDAGGTPQRLSSLADPQTTLYSGPTGEGRSALNRPQVTELRVDGSQAVVVERYGPADYRVLRITLPPAPSPPAALPTPARPPTEQRSIMELELDPPVQDALEAAGLLRLGDLTRLGRQDLLRVQGLEPDDVEQIQECLEDFGLTLRDA